MRKLHFIYIIEKPIKKDERTSTRWWDNLNVRTATKLETQAQGHIPSFASCGIAGAGSGSSFIRFVLHREKVKPLTDCS